MEVCLQRQLRLDNEGNLAIVLRKQDMLLTFLLRSQVKEKLENKNRLCYRLWVFFAIF